jgi:hypothetical protein
MKKRENNRCAICHRTGALEAMHIFVSRAKGGHGVRTNGVMGCCLCHRIMDNPIGDNENKLSKQYMEYCQNYLIEKEHIKDIKQLKNELIYHKEDHIIDMSLVIKNVQKNKFNVKNDNILQKNIENSQKTQEYCKNCKFLVKNKIQNSTIPAYYCKYRKINLHKNTKACKKYEYGNAIN